MMQAVNKVFQEFSRVSNGGRSTEVACTNKMICKPGGAVCVPYWELEPLSRILFVYT